MNFILRIIIVVVLFITLTYAQDTVVVKAGWNIIGAIETIQKDFLTTEPPGIIIAGFFSFIPGQGYSYTNTMQKGSGYWVKVSEDGIIIWNPITPVCSVTEISYEGKVYHTVPIGTQCWLQENLDVGTMITGTNEQTDNSTIEKYCYHDSVENCATYGALYQWNEAMQYSTTAGTQGICPTGWHIPATTEYETLSSAVGGDGRALKVAGLGADLGVGTNTSGFTALGAGYRFSDKLFYGRGYEVYTWSSTSYINDEDGSTEPECMFLGYYSYIINLTGSNVIYGFGVRCVED